MKKKVDSQKVNKKKIKRKLQGVVVSSKMPKTVVVNVERTKTHAKYSKIIKSVKKYKAHTLDTIQEGATVIIEECRPVSKTKAWKVIKVIEKK